MSVPPNVLPNDEGRAAFFTSVDAPPTLPTRFDDAERYWRAMQPHLMLEAFETVRFYLFYEIKPKFGICQVSRSVRSLRAKPEDYMTLKLAQEAKIDKDQSYEVGGAHFSYFWI